MASQSTSSQFPGFSHIYRLGEPGNSRAFRGRISLTVEEAFAVTRAEKAPERVEVRWAMGSKDPSDVIRATMAGPMIVSDRVVELLRRERFSGWQPYDVEVFGKEGTRVHGYQGLAVPGRAGPIENDRSEKFEKVMPAGVFPWWRGLYFDPSTWDGSDIFVATGRPSWIFVVETVKRALEGARVENLVFSPLNEVERSAVEMSVSLGPG